MYYFYILRCRDNTLYCGQSKDLKRRVWEHNFDDKKSAKYTKGRRPIELVYFEKYQTVQEVMKREWQVKKWLRSKKEVLIQNNKDVLKNYNPERSRGKKLLI